MSSPDLLQAAFDFTSADLEANRQGKISERQVKQVDTELMPGFIFGLVLLLIFGLAFMLGISGDQEDNSFMVWVSLLLGIPLFLGLVVLGWNRLIEGTDRHVAKICGMVVLSTWQYKQVHYQAEVYGIKFRLTSKKFYALENGQRYCLYFTPKTNIIVSVEKL